MAVPFRVKRNLRQVGTCIWKQFWQTTQVEICIPFSPRFCSLTIILLQEKKLTLRDNEIS